MHMIESIFGESIDKAAERLCRAAAEHGAAAMSFNGIAIEAAAGDTVQSILQTYERQASDRHVAWLHSPEGKACADRRDADIVAAQEAHDCLMRDLVSLDFSDRVAVLDWIAAMQQPSDLTGVQVRTDDILAAFSRHGFEPGVNTGVNYRDDDADNSFRYIVGQALSTLKCLAIHSVVHSFIERWKQRFA